jgi:hypothetical protein
VDENPQEGTAGVRLAYGAGIAVIDIGTRLVLRPLEGDEGEAAGRVVSSTVGSLVIRVGPHPWLRRGTTLRCEALAHGTLIRFVSPVDAILDHDGFAVRIHRPLAVVDANRRTAPRVQASHPVSWSRVDGGHLVGDHRPGITIDVSEGGLSFETLDDPPEEGALVAVAVDLPIGNMVTLGRVTGVDDKPGVHLANRHHVRTRSVMLPEDKRVEFRRWIADELARTLPGGDQAAGTISRR